ncbi:MAG: PEP-CTERM sorting domain-containing protein [Chthonomonadetes bacterium]|nr:PEP-CTERM sorting domain-containing protein [Chthonomonadetes bacterium]
MKKVLSLCALMLVMWVIPAYAFTPISSPDASYLASTTYINIASIWDGTNVPSITDGTLTVSFVDPGSGGALPMKKYTAPNVTWATWSAAPDSQRGPGDTLPVLFSNGATAVRFNLSMPVSTFGFEAEPNPFAVYTLTALFYDASDNLLGSITQNVDGNAGARLFAASSSTPISYVVFSGQVDWAAGAFRYALPQGGPVIPEPTTMALFGAGLLGFLPLRRRR